MYCIYEVISKRVSVNHHVRKYKCIQCVTLCKGDYPEESVYM